jgi:hypothetical protein
VWREWMMGVHEKERNERVWVRVAMFLMLRPVN